MNAVATPTWQLQEVSALIVPAPGVTAEQALNDAQPAGHELLAVNPDGTVTVVFYTRHG